MLQTVQKIGPLLDLFSVEKPEWGVSEVASAIGVPRSSAHALLASLVGTGLLQCRSRGRYRIGWRVVELGDALRSSGDVRSAAAPVLQELVNRFGETVHLAVLERHKALYLDKIEGTHQVHVTGARIGSQTDPHCTAVGKVLLADRDNAGVRSLLQDIPLRAFTATTITDLDALEEELGRVRARGYALDHGEAVSDVHCVAAPIRDEIGAVTAAMSMTVPAGRFASTHRDYQRAVVAAASAVSRRLVDVDPMRVRAAPRRLAAAAS